MKLCNKILNNKLKIVTVICLAIALFGMLILGIFGINQTVDYKDHKEVYVVVDSNLNGAYEIMKEESVKYFADKGLKVAAAEVINDGEKIVYKFHDSDKFPTNENVDAFTQGLSDIINAKFGEDANLNVLHCTVSANNVKAFSNFNLFYYLLGLFIALVVIFGFTLIFEGVSGALTTVLIGVCSAFLSFALIVLTRIPFEPFGVMALSFSGIIGAILTAVLTDRAKNLLKEAVNEKAPLAEISKTAYENGFERISFVSIAVAVAGIIFLIIGPMYLRFLGLQLICSAISVILGTGYFDTLWPLFKKMNKSIKNKDRSTTI